MAAGRARVQRETLADTLAQVGPASPTLCAGWTAHDLAAHLVTRERVPWAAPGLLISSLHGITERAERSTMRAHTFPDLVEIFRGGPPWWSPARLGFIDDAMNLIEFYIHTEDLRRALPGWEPSVPDATTRGMMWTALRLSGLAAFRRAAVGVVAVRTDQPGRLVLRRREPAVEIVGTPEELLLYSYGRRDVALVELSGEPDAVQALRAARVGL